MSIVQLERVSVRYPQYQKASDLIWEWLTGKKLHTSHYALSEISFQVEQGSSLGIVGDNGAGKSTLLRVLAGILKPTAGVVNISGHCAALLELWAGFQPHLSGLDNARLGLALRGLTSLEIEQYLVKVIQFAELEHCIEQPLKTYSTGMVMRLGFALATVIAPSVLIVDEALAVGDQHFQRKSLLRIKALLEQGASLIFCSHNLYQVRELCAEAIWLEHGTIREWGKAQRVVDAYQTACRERDTRDAVVTALPTPMEASKTQPFIQSAQLLHTTTSTFKTGAPFGVEVWVELNQVPIKDVHLGIVIRRNDNIQCYGMSTLHEGIVLQGQTQASVRYIMDELTLLAGHYCLELWLIDQTGLHVYDSRERCCPFTVEQYAQHQGIGVCQLPHRWEVVGL